MTLIRESPWQSPKFWVYKAGLRSSLSHIVPSLPVYFIQVTLSAAAGVLSERSVTNIDHAVNQEKSVCERTDAMVPQAGTRLTGGFLTERFASRLRRRRLGDWLTGYTVVASGDGPKVMSMDAGRVPASWIKDYL